MTKQEQPPEDQCTSDLGGYVLEGIANQASIRSARWKVGAARWSSGLKVAFIASLITPPDRRTVIVNLEEQWSPSMPDGLLPKARKKYFKERDAAIEATRELGQKIARKFPFPVLFHYPIPPTSWHTTSKKKAG